MKRTKVLWLGGAACALVSTVIAQTPKTAPPTAKPAAAPRNGQARSGNVRLRNHPQGRAIADHAAGTYQLLRDVVVTQDGEDFILYADDVVYNERTNEAVARGNLRVETRDSTITANLIRADFDAKMIYCIGKVVMKSHGEKDGIQPVPDKNGRGGRSLRQEVLHKPSSLTCDRIDYSYENQEARLAGNIRMRQGENFGTCELIIFDEANNIAQLMGSVEFTNGDKQTIKTRDLTVWIDSNISESRKITSLDIPVKRNEKTGAATQGKTKFAPPPLIPNDVMQEFGRKPQPLPTLAAPAPEDAALAEPANTPVPGTNTSTPTVAAPVEREAAGG
jgi:lipopolysaccharide assembly outer membrane protein LptD (OstA)